MPQTSVFDIAKIGFWDVEKNALSPLDFSRFLARCGEAIRVWARPRAPMSARREFYTWLGYSKSSAASVVALKLRNRTNDAFSGAE